MFVRETVTDLRRGLNGYVLYEIAFKIIAVLVLTPIATLIAAYFISFSGDPSVTNERLAAYAFSLPGMASLVLAGIASISVVLVELGGLTHMALRGFHGQPIKTVQGLRVAIRHTPELVGIAAILFFAWVMLVAPFGALAAGIYWGLLSSHDISFYLTHKPPQFWLAVSAGVLLVAGAALMTLPSATIGLMSVPVILVERDGLMASLKRSWALLHGSFRRIMGFLLFAVILFFVVSGGIVWIVAALGYRIADSLGAVLRHPVVLVSLVVGVHYLVSSVLTIVAFPLLAIVATRLYLTEVGKSGAVLLDAFTTYDQQSGESPARALKSRIVALVAFGVLLISSAILAVEIRDDLEKENSVKVTAHRGSSKRAPENTLSAIRAAVEDKADFAEIDVQETADGTVVLLHDSDLMKVAGVSKKIWEVSYSEVKKLDAGSWFSPEFAGEKIPTLAEAIECARDRIKLNIELKYNSHDKDLAGRVVRIVREHEFEGQCLLTSLNYAGLKEVRALDSGITIGHIVAEGIGDLTELDVEVLSVESRKATSSLINRARRAGKQVHVWTINEVSRMEHFIDLRVDNIITDHPEMLVRLLKKRAQLSDHERILRKAKQWLK